MSAPWPLPEWPDVPTRFVVFTDDRFFPAAFLRSLALERLGVVADELPGSHCAMLSHPDEVAALLSGYLD
jgi:pimeloyl-ACP methyl ester carboxylesterase